MKRLFAITGILLVLGLVPFGMSYRTTEVFAQAAAGWAVLFDGSNLNAFDVVGTANWKVVDGVVQADSGNGFLVSKNTYTNFEIKLEFWVSNDANSGVFIRCENPKQIDAMNAYEVNIFDTRPDQTYRTGSIVDVAPPSTAINTGGKWNTFEITARGPRMIVVLNGTQTVNVEHSAHARGPIALQYGAGTVKFRNVQIRAL